jgi:hypothetical protein
MGKAEWGRGRVSSPFDLQLGLLLEKRNVRLLWDTPYADLKRIGSPVLTEREDIIHLDWNDEMCLGGIRCGVGTTRVFKPVDPRAYHLYLDTLHFLMLEIRVTLGSIEQGFLRVLQHLRKGFGDETFFYPPYGAEELPGIFWERQSATICLSKSGDTYLSVSIRHTPSNNKYEEILAEAKAIREQEGEGSRRNGRWYV